MTVLVNGDVVPCCRDTGGSVILGNLLHERVENVWNNPAYRRFRRKVARDQEQVALCRLCEGYGMPDV